MFIWRASKHEENEVSDFEINDIPSYDELQNVFHELHKECFKLSRKSSKQKKIIITLESESNDMKVELDQVKNPACNKCQEHEFKIVELNQVVKKYKKGKIGLEDVLSRQRYSNDKCGFDFLNFDKACTKFNNVEPKKVHVVNHSKRPYVRYNSYVYKRNHVFIPTWFYYNTKDHTPNAFYIRNNIIPYYEYVWVRKITNPRWPKEYWVYNVLLIIIVGTWRPYAIIFKLDWFFLRYKTIGYGRIKLYFD